MPLDLTALGDDAAPKHLEPRDIYRALPNRPWPYLRQEQGEVLERWFEVRDRRDLVLRQNTGGGKTAIGLLICQSTLNELELPAVYIASDSFLVAQTRREAENMGLATTEDPRSSEFLNGEAILVTKMQTMVNGMSRFGVPGGRYDVIELGIVVIDDAHAALANAEAQFRLQIPKAHGAFDSITGLFGEVLRRQSPTRWAELASGDPGVTLRIPYWAWVDRIAEVVDALHPHRQSDEFRLVWPLIKEDLALCEATVTSKELEIRPLCPPIARIPSFAEAGRRVYLTATLADDSVLVTGLDADPGTIAEPVTPKRAADLGDRLILASTELNPGLDDIAVTELAVELAMEHNVVVLTPSDEAAMRWVARGALFVKVGELDAVVTRLKAGEHIGLIVLANKYDGIDLPGNACRVLVIQGLPRALSPGERRDAEVLRRSPVLTARQVQRIEQGMGRGVRDAEDYCAVLLVGSDLTNMVSQKKNRALFSPATAAQLDLSLRLAGQIAGEGIEAVRDAIDACLNRDAGWVKAARGALAQVTYQERQDPRPSAVAQRKAFNLASAGRFQDAGDQLATAAHDLSIEDKATAGWLREQQAQYVHKVDKLAAHGVQLRALEENSLLLRPAEGIALRPLRAVASQAQAASEHLSNLYSDGISLVLGIRELLDRITWEPDRTDDAEAAIQELGEHLGFATSRPDKEYGEGPDDLWGLSPVRQAVIELKTGSKAATICKDDVDQLGGSVRWAHKQDTSLQLVPVLLHRTHEHDVDATPPEGTRVVTEKTLEKLKDAVLAFATAIASNVGSWGNPDEVANQLTHHKLIAGEIFSRFGGRSPTVRPVARDFRRGPRVRAAHRQAHAKAGGRRWHRHRERPPRPGRAGPRDDESDRRGLGLPRCHGPAATGRVRGQDARSQHRAGRAACAEQRRPGHPERRTPRHGRDGDNEGIPARRQGRRLHVRGPRAGAPRTDA
jgi:hypothetical protein